MSAHALYPEIEPYASGMLDVGDGHHVYWEMCGNPHGKPALVVHGGPGSGCDGWWRQLYDPSVYRVVLFDQRNCGRSTPHAAVHTTDLSTNTTAHLLGDMEQLREHLEIERWQLLGGSWGSTLALAYAVAHPQRVSELILFGVTTGRHAEVDWVFRGGISLFFPEQWERFLEAIPPHERDGDVLVPFNRMLNDPDPTVRRAAADAWCLWESASPDWPPVTGLLPRFRNPDYALAFARIVVHYAHNNCFLEDGELLRHAGVLADIPGSLINGRFDFQGPIGNAWAIHRAWPRAELVIVEDAGHSASAPSLSQELVRATDRFRGQ